MSFIGEFKEFIARGNVMDLAVGVIIGAAFNKIVDSLVNDLIMPPLGLLLGDMDFSRYKLVLKPAVGETPAVTLNYGNFISVLINFLILAFVIFLLVKGVNRLRRKQEDAPEEPAGPTEKDILVEIRDLLAKRDQA